MLEKLDHPFVRKGPKTVTNVGIQHPIHLLPHDPNPERIQRFLGATPWSKPIREPQKVLLVNLIEDSSHSVLNDFVLQGCYAQRPLSPILLVNVGSLGR